MPHSSAVIPDDDPERPALVKLTRWLGGRLLSSVKRRLQARGSSK